MLCLSAQEMRQRQEFLVSLNSQFIKHIDIPDYTFYYYLLVPSFLHVSTNKYIENWL